MYDLPTTKGIQTASNGLAGRAALAVERLTDGSWWQLLESVAWANRQTMRMVKWLATLFNSNNRTIGVIFMDSGQPIRRRVCYLFLVYLFE